MFIRRSWLAARIPRQLSAVNSQRQFGWSLSLRNEGNLPNSNANNTASKETATVDSIDNLLSIIRRRSNPAYSTFTPVRNSTSWKDILAKSSEEANLVAQQPAAREETPLEPRYMHDSYTQVELPFANNPALLEQFTNAGGGLRTGLLMEQLDALAGSIAYKHVLGPNVTDLYSGGPIRRGFYLVTASVDRLDMLQSFSLAKRPSNIRLSGQVIYVGHSSIECVVRMEQLSDNGQDETTVMLGRFSMVARDAITHKARAVNPLILSTPEEQALFKFGESARARRKTASMISLQRVPPSQEEAQLLHGTFLKYSGLFDNGSTKKVEGEVEPVWMEDTRLEKTLMMFPQKRNVHSKVFGGYLMRLAYEIGYTNAYMFTRAPLRFLSLDGIAFKKPVPIGSILRLTSHISHTTSNAEFAAVAHVQVQAEVIDPVTGEDNLTNTFRFTWVRENGPALQRLVIPRTYAEAMQWLEGKRALDTGAEIRALRNP
ncbi:Acyl-coenzyme A thioesterase 9, mitochondrial [Rhizoctonia solani]|uniref:Acyl-coenzyme A thioesterase 9, mitochondrial n=1 Tax=Rhizoctonia solani TaxID=456999 RepID=A0A0K6GGZ6_9AGAM|nr:Acyl-coenzyme A thioesterase 9, mitochondrial [Rhizoctonia solani]